MPTTSSSEVNFSNSLLSGNSNLAPTSGQDYFFSLKVLRRLFMVQNNIRLQPHSVESEHLSLQMEHFFYSSSTEGILSTKKSFDL